MQTKQQLITKALIQAARDTKEPLSPYLAHQLPQHISASRTWNEHTADRSLLARLDPDDLAQTLTRDVFRTPQFTEELQVAICARPYLRGDDGDDFPRDLTATRLNQPTRTWHIGGAPPSLTPSVPLVGHTSLVTSGVFSPTGTRILTTSRDGTARIWDTTTGQPLHTLTGHTSRVTSGTFNPTGTLALTTSDDRTARIWSTEAGTAVRVMNFGDLTPRVLNSSADRILIGIENGFITLEWEQLSC